VRGRWKEPPLLQQPPSCLLRFLFRDRNLEDLDAILILTGWQSRAFPFSSPWSTTNLRCLSSASTTRRIVRIARTGHQRPRKSPQFVLYHHRGILKPVRFLPRQPVRRRPDDARLCWAHRDTNWQPAAVVNGPLPPIFIILVSVHFDEMQLDRRRESAHIVGPSGETEHRTSSSEGSLGALHREQYSHTKTHIHSAFADHGFARRHPHHLSLSAKVMVPALGQLIALKTSAARGG
jgi:hypothetical protein